MSLENVSHVPTREKLNRFRKVSMDHWRRASGTSANKKGKESDDGEIAAARKSSIVLRNELLFHEACIKNNISAAERLLEMKVDVNCKSHMSRTPLHWAVIHGDEKMIELLINAKCDLEATDKFGSKAVIMAASLGYKESLQKLIKAGADIHATTKHNRGILHCAVEHNQMDVLQYICESLENFDLDCLDKNNQTALHIAIEQGLSKAADMLIQNGCQLTIQDKYNQTPLHLAVKQGKQEMVEKLLKLIVDVNDIDVDGNTALHLAVERGDVVIAALLLNHKADINKIVTKKAWTPLHYASHLGHTGVTQLLLEYGAQVEAQDQNGNSPLHLAVACNHEDSVKLLISKHAPINSTNNRKQTPLHIASDKGHSNLVEILLVAGADVTARDKNGRMPLSIAARGSFICVVDTIIKVDRAKDKLNESNSSEEANKPDIQKLNISKTDPKCESLRQLLWQLATKQLKTSDWKRLALHWKFTQEHIKAIEHQYTGENSYKEHGYRMLLIWLSGVDDYNTVTKDIYEALDAIGRKDLAESFREKVDKQSSSRNTSKHICQTCYVL
ncbi:Ankyrin repeat and death domain-containing protein 1A [Chamberlinius hualienensis]